MGRVGLGEDLCRGESQGGGDGLRWEEIAGGQLPADVSGEFDRAEQAHPRVVD